MPKVTTPTALRGLRGDTQSWGTVWTRLRFLSTAFLPGLVCLIVLGPFRVLCPEGKSATGEF